jgi:hypothetical protein
MADNGLLGKAQKAFEQSHTGVWVAWAEGDAVGEEETTCTLRLFRGVLDTGSLCGQQQAKQDQSRRQYSNTR